MCYNLTLFYFLLQIALWEAWSSFDVKSSFSSGRTVLGSTELPVQADFDELCSASALSVNWMFRAAIKSECAAPWPKHPSSSRAVKISTAQCRQIWPSGV